MKRNIGSRHVISENSIIIFSLIMLIFSGCDREAALMISQQETEGLINPVGIDKNNPGLTWIMSSDLEDDYQTAFHILVASDQALLDRDKGDLDYVKAQHKSPYGLIKSEWHKKDGSLEWNITIPANKNATVYVPGEEKERRLGSGYYQFSNDLK